MEILPAAVVTFIATAIASPFVREILIRYALIDEPNDRSSHVKPVPRGGGLACLFGIITGTILTAILTQSNAVNVVIAASALALVGLLDDRHHLPPAPRLLSQIVVGSVLGNTLGGVTWTILGALAFPLFVNVVNFMDGINGITVLTLTGWGTTTLCLGIFHSEAALATIGAITAVSALGFLPWNAPRAQMFLGDVGSYLFGALAAGGVLTGAANEVHVHLLLAPLSIYLADVSATLMKRAIQRKPLLEAHREHVYQRVSRLIGSHMTVALGVAGASALVTAAWALLPPLAATLTTISIIILYLASPYVMESYAARNHAS